MIYIYQVKRFFCHLTFAIFLGVQLVPSNLLSQSLDDNLYHLRPGEAFEWNSFENLPAKNKLSIKFPAEINAEEYTLTLVQEDVRQVWRINLNNELLDSLTIDGNRMRNYYRIAPGKLRKGENTIEISAAANIPDDILVGKIGLIKEARNKFLQQGTIEINILDKRSRKSLPSRITIIDETGSLQALGIESNDSLAVRPGFVYTGNGKAIVKLPAGRYKLYAGRGFEYSVDSASITIGPAQQIRQTFLLEKEVDVDAISCDTHIHTLTHSGHGDATDKERVLTISGEGIDLPIITEHNKIRSFDSLAINMSQSFNSVYGNEVTTAVGHFNVWPLEKNDAPSDHRGKNWQEISKNLPDTSRHVVILNHARDIHSGFRPFDPSIHIAVAGVNRFGDLPVNAMEIVNSGALQNDRMLLFNDWFGLLNRGLDITPVAGSDSHDVSRYLVGQGRTYIYYAPPNSTIQIDKAADAVRKGKVGICFGLLPQIVVNKKYTAGDVVAASKSIVVDISLIAPSWANADRITLYKNGVKIKQQSIPHHSKGGIKWSGSWTLPNSKQDYFLVVIADAEKVSFPFWPIVKSYQPTSRDWVPYLIGSTGAVWVDADGDGKATPAIEYARRMVKKSTDFEKLREQLKDYDMSVTIQVLALLNEKDISVDSPGAAAVFSKSRDHVAEGYARFVEQARLIHKKK